MFRSLYERVVEAEREQKKFKRLDGVKKIIDERRSGWLMARPKSFEEDWDNVIKKITSFLTKEDFVILEDGIKYRDIFVDKERARKLHKIYTDALNYVENIKPKDRVKFWFYKDKYSVREVKEGEVIKVNRGVSGLVNSFMVRCADGVFRADVNYILYKGIPLVDIGMAWEDIFRYPSSWSAYDIEEMERIISNIKG